jgi:prevent-host-death family protein
MTIAIGRGDMGLREIPAGEFKAKCLQLMDDVQATGQPIIITKRGRPVAQLTPVAERPPRGRGSLKGTITYHDDVVRPTGEAWDAER